ncbi:MAG: hypothetical protein V1652_02095 [bacterium]
MEEQKEKVEDKIMAQIRNGRITVRSKYLFLAESLGFGSALFLSIVLGILFFNFTLFYMRATDNLEYLSFGSSGIMAFLESFPYLLVIGFVFIILFAGYLIKKSDMAYKKSFGYLATGLIIFIMLSGSALVYTNVSREIEKRAFESGGPYAMFKPFFNHGMQKRRGGIAGQIQTIEEGYLQIRTPHGEYKVDIRTAEYQKETVFTEGEFIVAIGEWEDDIFIAYKLRIGGEEIPEMLQRGMRRRFNIREERKSESMMMPREEMSGGEEKGLYDQHQFTLTDQSNMREFFEQGSAFAPKR